MICHSWDHLFFFEIFLPTMYKLELNHVFKWTPAKKKKSKTCPCTLGMGKKSTGGADDHVSMVLASWVPRRQWHRETCMRSNVCKFSDAPQVWLFYVPASCSYKGSGQDLPKPVLSSTVPLQLAHNRPCQYFSYVEKKEDRKEKRLSFISTPISLRK
jgi:hypothetical protein